MMGKPAGGGSRSRRRSAVEGSVVTAATTSSIWRKTRRPIVAIAIARRRSSAYCPSDMSTFDEFTKLATGGSYAQAVNWMDMHDSKTAFDGCLSLAVNHAAAFQKLWDSVPFAGDKV